MRWHALLPISLITLVAGCSLTPKYQKPDVAMPARFAPDRGFEQVQGNVAQPSGASWWEVFHDHHLNQLEDQLSHNQDAVAALARLDESRAQLKAAYGAMLPSASLSASTSNVQLSKHRATYFPGFPNRYTDQQITAQIGWEPDIFGRLHTQLRIAHNLENASQADLRGLQLSLQAQLARAYFQRVALAMQLKQQQQLLVDQQQYIDLVHAKFNAGDATQIDLDQAQLPLQALLENQDHTKQLIALQEHIMALLIGLPATGYHPQVADHLTDMPLPHSLPSSLLEQRPDIALAEQQVEIANEQIGLARTAYFPQFQLGMGGGYESSALNNLISVPSELWALGASAAVTLFDGGQRKALTQQARSHYDETVANYRQTVLNAYKEVEDDLSSLQQIKMQIQHQQQALALAQDQLLQTNQSEQGGLGNHLDVVAERLNADNQQLLMTQLAAVQAESHVRLLQALGQ
ncbi:MAG: efflux transporter outer membrane subunit [Pseudomonadales bacterium]|nr:efflux transporter outer membrane subunit [Pseudomonadales bacterium]